MKPKQILAAAFFTCAGLAAQASTFSSPYSSFWALGDSLTDNGNLAFFAPDMIPSPPYFEGRVSSGPTFAEYLAADFEAQGKPNANLAFAGARAVTNADDIPDLLAQVFAPIAFYPDGQAGLVTRAAQFGERPLVSLFFGSNDVLSAFSAGENPIDAASAAAAEVLFVINQLAGFGVSDFLVLGLPDFALVPRLNTAPEPVRALASAAALTFDGAVASGLGGLPSHIAVTQIDVFSALRDIVGDPDAFGLSNVTDSCLGLTTVCANPASFAFFDDIHPSGTVHLALANATREAFAPIPLPAAGWGLLFALASLGALRRHRYVHHRIA